MDEKNDNRSNMEPIDVRIIKYAHMNVLAIRSKKSFLINCVIPQRHRIENEIMNVIRAFILVSPLGMNNEILNVQILE